MYLTFMIISYINITINNYCLHQLILNNIFSRLIIIL